ncbi:high affinity immunoglobulin epsilon receptor subunit beta-like [Hemicordylus capensis]|uniref:high affinity immunoglobulin epsilon receptor subunit beta-like n=1 Tax=Hemicordylus capensis TaxID=884348 RepID=UPI0023039EC6|nr:high affinity immunoglobulin epsilon receptor subunit beta-like [Hemicordylus capensis]
MSTSALEEKGAEGPMERPGGHTSIDITILQESSLAYLAKAVGQCWAGRQAAAAAAPKPAPRAPASAATVSVVGKGCGSGEEKALGGAQILLGVVCISLGVLVQQERFFHERLWSGAPFWMGGLFIASGTSAVVSGRRGSRWVYPAMVFHLASVVACCVALTQGIARIPNLSSSYSLRKDLCESQQPWASTPSYDWRAAQCQSTLWSLLTIAFATRILLLIFSVAALGIAFSCLLVLCCRLRAKNKNYAIVGDPEVPPPYEDAARTENIA